MKNSEVVQAWVRGEEAANQNGSFRSDGDRLFSYDLLIAFRFDGSLILLDYTGPDFVSQTTSKHVGLVRKVSRILVYSPDRVSVAPEVRDSRASLCEGVTWMILGPKER